MTVFQLDVRNQKLSLSKYAKQIITTNSINFFECLLNFDGVWNDNETPLTKTIVFYQSPQHKYEVLVENNKCTIPGEVLLNHALPLYVGIIGISSDPYLVVTTNIIELPLVEGMSRDHTQTPSITPTMYDQLLTEFTRMYTEIIEAYSSKQDKVDDNLNTRNKSVVGAINELNSEKQDQFANVEDLGGDLHLTPSQSAVYFDGRFRYTPDPNADENEDDIVNRDILESYHDTTKQDNIAEVQNNVIIFDDKRVVFPQIPISDNSPENAGDLTTKSYVDQADLDLQRQITATQTVLNGKVNQVFATWLNSNSGEWDNIYQCLDTGYGFTEGYFYVKKMNPQTAEIYWENIPVQDLSNYYIKSETDSLLQSKADEDSFVNHTRDHTNPHQVTKSQVGLGNVDNTSDADKPISAATQTALNAKANISDVYTQTQTDNLLNTKQDIITSGENITILNNTINAIVPIKTISYFGRELMIDGNNNVELQMRKSILDSVLVPNTMYDLGSSAQSEVNLQLPDPNPGDNFSCNDIYVAFKSGSTATTLSIVGTCEGDTSYLPGVNSLCELSFKYICGTWVLITKETVISNV